MGLIKAAISSAKTTLADQWLEYFYCDSLSDDVLVKKASKRVDAGSNTKGSPDVITNGSGIAAVSYTHLDVYKRQFPVLPKP